jgi:hypothetical protein
MAIWTNREGFMRTIFMIVTAVLYLGYLGNSQAVAQSKSERCSAYARDAARSTPTTTGAARGAARGAMTGAVLGGDAGTGAAIGAVVGSSRRAAQRSRSYQSYYNECMRR